MTSLSDVDRTDSHTGVTCTRVTDFEAIARAGIWLWRAWEFFGSLP